MQRKRQLPGKNGCPRNDEAARAGMIQGIEKNLFFQNI